MESPFLSVLAVGKADLVDSNLDFRVEPKVVKKLASQDKEKVYSNVTVPVPVSGTFAAPKFSPDLDRVAKQQIQEKLLESDKVRKIHRKERASEMRNRPRPFEKLF